MGGSCWHGNHRPSVASKMASPLPELLFEISGQAPSPSKDYHHLTVNRNRGIKTYMKRCKKSVNDMYLLYTGTGIGRVSGLLPCAYTILYTYTYTYICYTLI